MSGQELSIQLMHPINESSEMRENKGINKPAFLPGVNTTSSYYTIYLSGVNQKVVCFH